VDFRHFRRDLVMCGDPECPCHDLYGRFCGEDNDDHDVSWIKDGVLTADWSAIPADHLLTAPLDYRWTLPVSGKEVVTDHHRVKDKANLLRWGSDREEDAINKGLTRAVVELQGEKNKGVILDWLKGCDSADRFWLKEQITRVAPDVDVEVDLTCKTCKARFQESVPLGLQLFIPSFVILPTWFLSVRASAQATGTSVIPTSWAGPPLREESLLESTISA